MGNVIGIQISCDAIFSRCLNSTVNKASYISQLEANLTALQTQLKKLSEARNDVLRRVTAAEQRQMKRTDQVQGWISRVQAVETEVGELISTSAQETQKLCLGGFCSKNCKSSYTFGKQVAKKLQVVTTLICEGSFEVVAQIPPESGIDERPTEPMVVGLQSTLEKVWRCLVEEPAGIIGLYGMGGVGKTTLLTQINNKFIESPTDFDYVIWVLVSKDLRLEEIQESIGKKIGLFGDSWKNKNLVEKALDIFKILRENKFVLLLDDIWERVDLTKVGIPLPSPQNTTASKVVFTTRFINVCGSMEAHRKFRVASLSDEDAWELFREKVGEETLESHHDILPLAQTVAKECGGLPLALITIGRAMAYKKTTEEWRYAIEVLRRSASEFAGLGKEVYPLLKFSYDSLSNDAIRSCFLYCCLYAEDYSIRKSDLIDCWACEGFLGERERLGAQNQGYYIVGTLVHACLLEEVDYHTVKMHDVIRDMALWITCEIEKERENFLVYAGAGLAEAPDIRGWENVKRLSLMQNQIKNLSQVPTCPHLLTLFLNHNKLEMITGDFFQFMPSLKVLKMSNIGRQLWRLPVGISKLVSLQLLDISNTHIQELPQELKALVNLECLNLEWASDLIMIPRWLISNFLRLRVLKMSGTGYRIFHEASVESVLFGRGEVLAEELIGLKYLEVLDVTLKCYDALQRFLISHKLRSCIQTLFLQGFKDSKSIDVSALADLQHLNTLYIWMCEKLEELKIDHTGVPCAFHNLHKVDVSFCPELKDLTFLIFAPNLNSIWVRDCAAMEEIISVRKFADIPEMMGKIIPFANLKHLELVRLRNLKSIYWKSLPFPHLKEMKINICYELKKLPLDSNSAKERKIVIRGTEYWWRRLQWEDESTQNAFVSCFKSLESH